MAVSSLHAKTILHYGLKSGVNVSTHYGSKDDDLGYKVKTIPLTGYIGGGFLEMEIIPELSNPLDALLPCPQPVTLHPNPSTGLLRISDARKLRSGTHINIHNLKGQIVHSGVLTSDPDSGEYLLDVSPLSSGVYFLEVYSPVDFKIGSLKGPKKLMRFIKF